MNPSDKTISPSDAALPDVDVAFQAWEGIPHDQRTFAMVSIRALFDDRLTDKQFRVLCAYWSYANKRRITFVGQTRIAANLGIDQTTVSSAVRRLRQLGYMGKAKRPPHKFGGAQTHGLFFVPVPPQQQQDEVEAMLASQGAEGTAPPLPVAGTFVPMNSQNRDD